ncbi:hypothetical protein QYF36_015841 [Acer negundo]|nr:hypothetical protein QYF36_015841 [Acer negundo]
MKDVPFVFDEACLKAFDLLRKELVSAPIMRAPNWDLPFELIKEGCKAKTYKMVLLLQEFNLEIKDKKETENVVADHLSRLERDDNRKVDEPIKQEFPDEQLFELQSLLIPWCIPEEEMLEILGHCHTKECGGHFGASRIARKVLQSGFWWPSLFKDSMSFVEACDRCQRTSNITKRDEMPMNVMLEVKLFDVWGIDFMGPFPMSFGKKYILVTEDYVSKWIEAIATPTCEGKEVTKFLKGNIFTHFGTPRAIDWAKKLGDTLWVYRTAYKSPIGMSPFLLVYGKACHLPFELEHKAWWAIKHLNMSMLKLFPGKLKSRWMGLYTITEIFPYGTVEIEYGKKERFKVNG